jgi:mono/diheme cytochrome c family protein
LENGDMMRWFLAIALTLPGLTVLAATRGPSDPGAARRGEQALLTRSFNPPVWSQGAYRRAWRSWGDGEPPADYDRAFMDRCGLHPAPYPNGGYPMGLRAAPLLLRPGLTTDCLVCHGGSIAGHSYLGLGNASLDFQTLYEDLNVADGRNPRTPFTFTRVRGTVEAVGMVEYLASYRNLDLSLHVPRRPVAVHDDVCEDVPAWWLLKKKKTMYHTGGGDARSVRSLMQFMLSPLNTAAAIAKEEYTFADIQEFIRSIEPPKYPFAIDRALACKGEAVFRATCGRCHGTYGERWTYPNRIVPIDVIGTDRRRFDALGAEAAALYNQSWFAHEKKGWLADGYPARVTAGYQAPPLDGIWATAPYFHNGSVPTVYQVLNSKARPRIFTRSYRTGKEDYDPVKLGWKVTVLEHGPDAGLPAVERRKVYDTREPGRGNGGHRFGDKLTQEERMAVIEYLKTL